MKKLAPVSNFQMECLTAILYAKMLSIEQEKLTRTAFPLDALFNSKLLRASVLVFQF